ncbi:McrC family protein [Mycobacterium sp. E3198]|uniref:McrC family protein n=1 Tax=Mycobacterium sp. E3198 TaxID=1834143 RepID=UPI00080185F0|nr:restriction endonuclease [Mycobacterium sp. E3198]OBG41514.1 restriction endonuclease [Mycobacterium sp. E3198]
MAAQPLLLTEGESPQTLALTDTEYLALQQLALVNVTPTLTHGLFDVAASRKVGAVVVGQRQVVVRPKITDLNRLLFLLGYAQDASIWRDDLVQLSGDEDLLPALAEAFGRIALRAVEQGLLQGYRTVTDRLPVLRGRLLAGEQMTRLYGLPVPVAVEYDDFTIDIAENRLLLLAVNRLIAVPRLGEAARRRLQRLRRILADVTVIPRGAELPKWHRSRLNARYHPALALAQIVLAAESFEHRVGDLTVTGYMFDMWRVFEDFVTTALRESLHSLGGGHSVCQKSLSLDERDRVVMRPDLMWLRDGKVRAVVDAKYKAERPEGFPNADLYQMLAYCTVLGLTEGHLVYAKGNEPIDLHTARGSGVVIHCHALDLTVTTPELLQQVEQLAATVAHARPH